MAIAGVEREPSRSFASKDSGLWVPRRARTFEPVHRFWIGALGLAGAALTLGLADWWFRAEHVQTPWAFVVLSLAFWYGVTRILLGWLNLTGVHSLPHRPAPQGRSVAIFTTSTPGEPLAMFEQTLAACRRIRMPHRTYLLDDTQDPRFRDLAERTGAVWMELVGVPGAKAGKINAALENTDEEFILVLDPDHIPFPDFFDRVLGHFEDPQVGFVQVSQAYYNQNRSFVARGAAEQTYLFYGPTQMGLFGRGGAVAIGANCTFRRSALESIGGHGIGLAEDLVTSIRLHSAGWTSVYVPEILSRGLVPEDLGSFLKQQLKWSRGVYEVLFAELPRAFPSLTGWQRLSYLAIGTYYLFGVTTPLFLIIPYLFLWSGLQPASMDLAGLWAHGGPVAALGILLYLGAQRWLCHPEQESGLHLRGMILKFASWPIVLIGTISALIRYEIPYLPTAKEATASRVWRTAGPHLVLLGLFVATTLGTLGYRLLRSGEAQLLLSSEAVWGMTAFALLGALTSLGAVWGAWSSRRVPPGQPWESVAVDQIGEFPSSPPREGGR